MQTQVTTHMGYVSHPGWPSNLSPSLARPRTPTPRTRQRKIWLDGRPMEQYKNSSWLFWLSQSWALVSFIVIQKEGTGEKSGSN